MFYSLEIIAIILSDLLCQNDTLSQSELLQLIENPKQFGFREKDSTHDLHKQVTLIESFRNISDF